MKGLSAGCAQAMQMSAPPGRSARRMLEKAATGSSKNITPKRETTASWFSDAKAWRCASAQKADIGLAPKLGPAPRDIDKRLGNVEPGAMALAIHMAGNRQAGRASAAADIQNPVRAFLGNRIDQQALEGHEEPVEHQLQIGPDMALRTAPAGRFGDVIVHEIVLVTVIESRPFCHFKPS
jgi:hypothetical protein